MAPIVRASVGQTLDGRFLLLEEIGRGGMATVFKALDLANRRELVAVKVPLPEFSSGLGSWSMFQRETEIGTQLDHPYVLRFRALPPSMRRSYVVTEYVPGTALSSRVGHGRRLEEREALGILTRVCEAVEYMHARGFVHYDLKPENVLLCGDGSIRLIDLGMAHPLRKPFSIARATPPIASANYVAPEQIRRRSGLTSVDIYALGAMLYEMLTGHPPFEGDDPFAIGSARRIADPVAPRKLARELSRQTEEVVLRALRRASAERYPTAAALRFDLEHIRDVRVSGLADRLVPATTFRKSIAWARYIGVVGVLPIVALVAAFRALWWYLDRR